MEIVWFRGGRLWSDHSLVLRAFVARPFEAGGVRRGARSGRTDAVVARSGGAAAAPRGCYLTAMVSISTSAPMGSAATSKATRAGGFSV